MQGQTILSARLYTVSQKLKGIFRGIITEVHMLDNTDKGKIEKIIHDRKAAHSFYIASSKVYEAFHSMEQKAFTGGEVTKTEKELIALGISIVINCESCMEWHLKEALRTGASERQVIEAIEVCIEMGGGPATVSARFALKVLEYYRENKPLINNM
jgi:AhpD family alkylhydroperoxidase